MARSFVLAIALASAALVKPLPASAQATDRTLPMRFDLQLQGPANACGSQCRLWISASGAITADTPHDFELFTQGRDLAGATVVLDSDGGSVLGAIALGRDIRRRGLDTTVGRIVDVPSGQERPRGRYVPHADCESMCGFVLLGGVHRAVPPEARVMVHQIWLGDRRDDPTAANYTAEDLVLVQRDIGRLARYTIDMGGSIDFLNLALRIPPWEPMHALTTDEARSARLTTDEPAAPVAATVAASPAATRPVPRVTDGPRATVISERRWAMVDRAGVTALARRQPLTVEGEDIGSFDLMLACGTAGGDSYDVSYVERRHNGNRIQVPAELDAVTLTVGRMSASLKVGSSERRSQPDELVTYAAGTVPAALVGAFAAVGNHSMLIETQSAGMVTGIRFGNTGAQQNLPRLIAACVKAIGDRADLSPQKTGGLASAK
ncbi:MAG TPA: hypothetical protein VLN61_05880 [Pseudolabrys sp.]|nr:hypothetical protein [Pseudolabrys sp.]